ncbi:platelet-activating factor acetylhydrolase [Geospiza fortis]|uniref:1-alkyl-2-acetylglycerophosphocholine esterase n=2 Tax=Thraupidae TaxID=400783 RepID=A0A6I9ZC77_GEOFO|nr:platelet-activating factor acetylhydrolase [Geospiza fortis]XP_030801713.1 platelet-activating factor acetylhydrolase [Camarhynchus parvulus]
MRLLSPALCASPGPARRGGVTPGTTAPPRHPLRHGQPDLVSPGAELGIRHSFWKNGSGVVFLCDIPLPLMHRPVFLEEQQNPPSVRFVAPQISRVPPRPRQPKISSHFSVSAPCCLLLGIQDTTRKIPSKTDSSVKAPIEMWSTNSTEKFYRIPEGKGPHSVGCTDLMTENAVEGSFLRLYYPAYDATDIEEARWIPDKEYYQGLSDFLNMYRVVGERLFHYYVGSVTCPAKSNAAFKPGEKYPLLVFSHGLGAFRTIYSAICIEMASQGFIVAAVEHRDESASATYYCKRRSVSESQEECPPNMEKEWIYYRKLKTGEEERCLRHKQVQQRAQECIKALNLILKINSGEEVTNVLHSDFDWNSLKDSVDTSRIAVMGHSFGGATVIESLSKEIRFRCGIALDVWMLPVGDDIYQNSVQQPLLFINSEKFQWAENILKIKKLISNDTNKKMITIKGSVHQSFPDFTFVSGGIIARFFKLKGEIDPNEAIDISNHASLAFLQKHLSLKKDFDQWDSLVDGIGPNVIPGTNIDTSPAEPE